MKRVSLADAKAHLSRLVEEAAAGETVCITRRGKGGSIEISFGSEAELNRIYEHITGVQ